MVFAVHHHELAIGIHVSPLSLSPLPPCLPPHPFRLSQSTDLGCLVSASNSHWLSVLHMVMCIFQCYFLKSSHPLLLQLSPKSLFFMYMSTLLPCTSDHQYHLSRFNIYSLKIYSICLSLSPLVFLLARKWGLHQGNS